MNNLQHLWHRLTIPYATDESDSRREYMTKVVLVILILVNGVLFFPFLIGALVGALTPEMPVITLVMEILLLTGWWAADRGYWRWAGYVALFVFFALALKTNYDYGVGSVAILIYASVVLLAAILQEGKTRWGMLVLCIVAYLGFGWLHIQNRLPQAPAPEDNASMYFIAVTGILTFMAVLQWFYTSQFQRTQAELVEHKATLEQRVAERTAELEESMAERELLQQQVIEAQKQAIQELSTPVIPLMNAPDGRGSIIVMPLIGSIDTMRARDITRALLAGISKHQARVVILDVTGVSIMDTGIVNHLNKTIQAAQLKGARTIVTGISDEVAETIVDLGIDWGKLETLRDLQTGLVTALSSVGVKLSEA
ncbi:MAG: STAS domain-containing protein [Anaerolineae bacterium]|nr:STAS domain-containing protein [Anaerolineae bacterium]